MAQIKKLLSMAAVLSLSVLLPIASVNNSALPLIARSNPNVPAQIIDSIGTLPSFTVIIFLFISIFLQNKIGVKKTILTGLFILLISGLIPVFTSNIWVILASRLGVGAGIGLFNSLAVSIISMMYSGSELTNMMGLESTMSAIGGTIMTLLAGFLLKFGWHNSFYVYLLIIPVILLFSEFVHLQSNKPAQNTQVTQGFSFKNLGPNKNSIIFIFLIYLLYGVVYGLFGTQLPSLIVQNHISTASGSAIVLTLFTIGAACAGILFGTLVKWLKSAIAPLSFLTAGIASILITFTPNLILASIASFIFGFGIMLAYPFLNTKIGQLSSPNQANANQAISLICMNLGIMLSNYIFLGLDLLVHNSTAQVNLIMLGIIALITAIVIAIFLPLLKQKGATA